MVKGAPGDGRQRLGRASEDRAVAELRRRGYHILERNFRCALGELDIIARDGDTLVFVEVRARSHGRYGQASETVGPRKQRKLIQLATLYLASRDLAYDECRFDVVSITVGRPSFSPQTA